MRTSSDWRSALAAALLVGVVATSLYLIRPAFFLKDDFQTQFLPASRDVARAWTSGSVPLLSPYSWHGGALAGEYQFGVFSPVRALLDVIVWLLPLSLTARAAFLFIAHAVICAAGAFLLARSYEVRGPLALMAAIAGALNGWLLWWGTSWIVAMAAFAWLPWYWLALRRRSWIGAALALALLITAGSPYVAAMAVAVLAMNVRRQGLLPMLAGSVAGVALASPALLALVEYFPATARASMGQRLEPIWFVPPASLFGLVVPSFTVPWPVFAGRLPHSAVELLGAFAPLAAVASAVRKRELLRRLAPELVLLAILALLVMLPAPAPFRWSFHWLPLFHLTLAIAGASALEHAPRAWRAGIVLVAVAAAAAIVLDSEWRVTLIFAAVLAALCVAWRRLPDAMPATISLLMIVGTFLAFSGRSEIPTWPYDDALEHPAPLDPARRYLALYDLGDVVARDERHRFSRGLHPQLRPGNLGMLAGVELVNGYSPMGLTPLKVLFDMQLHGGIPAARARQVLAHETAPNQLLHHIGVDGLIVPNAIARDFTDLLARRGWRAAGSLATCTIFHRLESLSDPIFSAARATEVGSEKEGYAAIFRRRTPQLPVVLLTPGSRGAERYGRRAITGVVEGRLSTSFVVRGKGPKALVVFRRPWLPGYRATIGGRTLPVLRADMLMPAVEIPPDAEGEVQLRYRIR